MSLVDTIRADLVAIAADMGNPTFTWDGEDYACIVGSAASVLLVDEGGFESQADLLLIVNKALFTDGILPQSQQTLVFRTKTYRIVRATIDPSEAVVRLVCVSPTRGV